MRRERGVATVQAVAVVALLALVAVGCLQVALVVGLRQRAAAAADLSALAASRASVEGDDPCAVAAEIARENGATLRDCVMDADVATITVGVESPHWSVGHWFSEQRARAVPVWYLG